MAYFQCMSSSGGAGATITVTYDSSFYNKTMTCSNGTKTYTKTTTSSGSTTFNVNEEGTWTITCNGVSRTVNVVLSYSTQMAITKTITVYSAASDTVSFTDITGGKTCTTDTSGVGSVSISFIPNSTITFTSLYAKDPSNLSNAYSKTITMTDSITSIYVMPNGALYWYGYVNGLQSVTSGNGWTVVGFTAKTPTWNTRDIYCPAPTDVTYDVGLVGNTNAITSGTSIKLIYKTTGTSKAASTSNTTKKVALNGLQDVPATSGNISTMSRSIDANKYYTFGMFGGTYPGPCNIYAVWVE